MQYIKTNALTDGSISSERPFQPLPAKKKMELLVCGGNQCLMF